MATLEISWWGATAFQGGNVPNNNISNETLTITGSSASSAAVTGADIVSVYANGSAAKVTFGASPTAASTSIHVGSGERLWLKVPNTTATKVAGITTT